MWCLGSGAVSTRKIKEEEKKRANKNPRKTRNKKKAWKTVVPTNLSSNELHELANCHTGWKPVGVHDHIGAHTIIIERHVLLPNNQPTHTLLPVAAAEFVAQLGNASASHPDLSAATRKQE